MPLTQVAALSIGLLIGLLPILWVARAPTLLPGRWWLMGAGFGVSFLADAGSLLGQPMLLGNLYPLSQAGCFALALRDRRTAVHLVGFLTLVAVVSVGVTGTHQPEVLLNTVASLTVAGLALQTTSGALRIALLVSFGLGAVGYWWLVAVPGWPTWLGYQGTRLAAALLFCRATGEA